jgi:hypothetical protein
MSNLEDISCLHILKEKNNNVDQLTQGEEINTPCITLSVQQFVSCSNEVSNVKDRIVDCETIPCVVFIDSQLKSDIGVLMEEVIPFKETTIENNSLSRETFHSLISSTFYSLYPNLFYGCVV